LVRKKRTQTDAFFVYFSITKVANSRTISGIAGVVVKTRKFSCCCRVKYSLAASLSIRRARPSSVAADAYFAAKEAAENAVEYAKNFIKEFEEKMRNIENNTGKKVGVDTDSGDPVITVENIVEDAVKDD
jgi:hypothetical protein